MRSVSIIIVNYIAFISIPFYFTIFLRNTKYIFSVLLEPVDMQQKIVVMKSALETQQLPTEQQPNDMLADNPIPTQVNPNDGNAEEQQIVNNV